MSSQKTVSGLGVLRPRLFRIGPGLVLAVVASLFVWWQYPPRSNEQTRIQRVPLQEGSTVGFSAPDPVWLLGQRAELKLNTRQVAQLNRLRARWEHDTGELRSALARASDQFNREMGKVDGPRLTMQQLQERAAPVSELSRQLAMARHAWWEEAAKVLSAQQRRYAEENWARRFTRPR